MGLLTDYLRQRHQNKLQEKENQIAGYRLLMQSPDATPEAKQWAFQQTLKTSGVPEKETQPGGWVYQAMQQQKEQEAAAQPKINIPQLPQPGLDMLPAFIPPPGTGGATAPPPQPVAPSQFPAPPSGTGGMPPSLYYSPKQKSQMAIDQLNAQLEAKANWENEEGRRRVEALRTAGIEMTPEMTIEAMYPQTNLPNFMRGSNLRPTMVTLQDGSPVLADYNPRSGEYLYDNKPIPRKEILSVGRLTPKWEVAENGFVYNNWYDQMGQLVKKGQPVPVNLFNIQTVVNPITGQPETVVTPRIQYPGQGQQPTAPGGPPPPPSAPTPPKSIIQEREKSPEQRSQEQDTVKQFADRLETGEAKLSDAKTTAMQGQVIKEMNRRNAMILDDKDRDMLRGLEQTGKIVDQIEKTLDIVSKHPTDIQSAARLNALVNSVTAILSRSIYMERGVLTDPDVKRAGGLLPGGFTGYITAALVPKYPKENLNVIRKIIADAKGTIYSVKRGAQQRGEPPAPTSPLGTLSTDELLKRLGK